MSLCINPQCKKPSNSDTLIFCKGCGSELLIDGRYRVIRELGQGGFGTTYEVLDLLSQTKVLKVLMDNHPKYIELFQQEAEILNSIQHPSIPALDLDGYFQYFPAGKKEPMHCIVMEKIEGLNLEQYLKERGNRPIREKRAIRWLAELALILEQIHNHDFLHRDIKPQNIMLRANGWMAMIDFGTARHINAEYQKKQAVGAITSINSPGYAPIEQVQGKAMRQSDFYALGQTILFLLTAKRPQDLLENPSQKAIWQDFLDDINVEFEQLIQSLVAVDPQDRPNSARDIFNKAVSIEPSLLGLDEYFSSGSISSPLGHTQLTKLAAESSGQETPNKTIDEETTLRATTSKFAQEEALIPKPPSPLPKVANQPKPQKSSSPISPEFAQRCCQELAEFVGPIAKMLCDRIITENPHFSEPEIVHTLSLKIEDPQQAETFRQKLL